MNSTNLLPKPQNPKPQNLPKHKLSSWLQFVQLLADGLRFVCQDLGLAKPFWCLGGSGGVKVHIEVI